MSRAEQRLEDEVKTGRISEVGDFILEYIENYGCDDRFIEDQVHIYFERLNEE